MRDNLLIAAIISVMQDGLVARGLPTVLVKQSYQPTQQGVPTAPTLFLDKISDHRYGHPQIKDVWDEDAATITHTEKEWIESTFQFTGLSIQDPTDLTQLTASDIVNTAAAILQSAYTRTVLLGQGIGIYRIMEIRTPKFSDDKGNFEYSPSFDFTLTHEQIYETTAPVVETTRFNINRV